MKNKWMKKLLSAFLAVLMAMSAMMPITSYAANSFTKESKTFVLQKKVNGTWYNDQSVTLTATDWTWKGSIEGNRSTYAQGTCNFVLEGKLRNETIRYFCMDYTTKALPILSDMYKGATVSFFTNKKKTPTPGIGEYWSGASFGVKTAYRKPLNLKNISRIDVQENLSNQYLKYKYRLVNKSTANNYKWSSSSAIRQACSSIVTATQQYRATSVSNFSTTIIPKYAPLIATKFSSDGRQALVTYKGKQYWVNTQYFKYIKPTITKPDPPTVTLKTAQDIPLGGLITVDWNTPTDAKYFTAILKDESGKEMERYSNIYGNSTSFQSQKPGKYTVEVLAQNSEYTSDPGKLGKTITVHDFSTVTFLDEDGTELGKQQVAWGDNAVALIAPEKKGHTFKSWSGSLFGIKEDSTVTAQYDKAQYTVEFIGYQSDDKGIPSKEVLLKKETAAYGEDVTPPAESEIVVPKNYEFLGWSSDEYNDVYTPYKNESIKIYAVYGWKNKDLPVSCEITEAKRQANGYYVYYNLSNYPDAVTRGRAIVALKTSEGKLIDMTESSAFSLDKNETETGARIFVPCEKAATTAELYIVNGYTNNGMSDGIPISNKATSAVVEGKMWSDWGTEPIAETGDNEVESRTEYSYRNVRETTGNTSVKPDWVTVLKDNVITHGEEYEARLTDTSYLGSYTNAKRTDNSSSVGWSAWTWNEIKPFDSESTKREIDTQTAVKSYNYKTQYNYSRYYNSNRSHYGPWAAKWGGSYCGNYEEWGWHDYALSVYSTAEGFNHYNRYADPWYNQNTRSAVASTNTSKQWRYRDITYTYYFYRWDDKDWSDWSADEVTATDKREVQTRTVYREKSVSAGIEDVSGELRHFSGNVGEEFAGKNITFFVSKYNAISDFTDEYVAQGNVEEDGSYSFDYKLREEPSAETGDFTIMIGLEGATEKQVVGTIEAPKPVYTVKFYGDVKDNNPEVLYEATVRQGETVDLPAENPTIDGKKFICWNNSCTNVQSDLEVYPVFEDEEYTVIFVDWRKQTIETQKYKYGEALIPPVAGENGDSVQDEDGNYIEYAENIEVEDVDSGYGRGWDYEEGTLVTSDMVVEAVYETKTFDVTFHDYDGTVLDTQTVEYDGVAEAPELPDSEEDGVDYFDWNIEAEELYGVKENIDVFPRYEFDETTPNPTASVSTGAYDGAQTVSLSCEDENAVIYYTLDGTEPQDNFDALVYGDWSPAEAAPQGVVPTDKKWTYDLYTPAGEWSSWSWEPCSPSATLEVETQQAIRSYDYRTKYHYYRWAANAGSTSSSNVQQASYSNYYSFDLDAQLEYGGTNSQGVTYYRYYTNGDNWIAVYQASPFTTQETASANYAPQYRYRTREKTETLESETEVTESDAISNVRKWVKFNEIPVSAMTELNFYASSFGKNDSEVVTEYYVINNDGVIINMHDNVYGEEGVETYLADSLADSDDSVLELEGYTLEGVYSDADYTQPVAYDSDTTTKGEIDLYAKYNIDSYTVTFAYEDGSEIDTQIVNYAESAEAPAVEDEGNMKFVGWDSDEWNCVTEDITVHPVFKDESEIIDITFDRDKYQMEAGATYKINATITAPEEYEDVNDAVVWSSDNEEVATVDNTGEVTSLKAGTANIYATSVDDINMAVCEITVAPSVNNSIVLNNLSSLGVDSEGYLRKIPLDGTNTVDNISTQFVNANDQLTFTNAKGSVLSGADKIGTNTVISLMNGDEVLDFMTVVMTGDVTCDGIVNNRDVSYAARVIVKRNTADAGQLRAMDANGDGKVNNRDVALLSRYLVGKETINN